MLVQSILTTNTANNLGNLPSVFLNSATAQNHARAQRTNTGLSANYAELLKPIMCLSTSPAKKRLIMWRTITANLFCVVIRIFYLINNHIPENEGGLRKHAEGENQLFFNHFALFKLQLLNNKLYQKSESQLS